MGKEEQLLQYWRELNEAQQEQVFQVVRAFKAQASSQAAPTTNPLDLLEAAGLVGHLDFEPEQSYKSAST